MQTVFWTALFHNKFTLWHIKSTTYMKQNKFTSSKQYLFGFFLSGNWKKTLKHRRLLQVFLLRLKSKDSQPWKLSQVRKIFPLVCMLLVQLALINVFITCDNTKPLVSIKGYHYLEVLLNSTVVAFFEISDLKEVRLLNFISSLLIPNLKYNANTKILNWSSHISYLLNFLKYFYFLMYYIINQIFLKILTSGNLLFFWHKFVFTNRLVRTKSQSSSKHSKTSLTHLFKHIYNKYMDYDLNNI